MLQPGYLPWLGFFGQALSSDIFVVYDDAQYTKQDWRNRNRIKTKAGKMEFLTVPIQKAPVNTPIRDIRISYDHPWHVKHLNLMKEHYSPAPWFDSYFPLFSEILRKKPSFLIDLDMELILLCMQLLGLHRRVMFSSKLATPVRGKGRLLAACRELGATHCYNGKAGEALYETREFLNHGIVIEFQNFRCPVYPQLWGDFIANLSIIDVLYNCGEGSLDVIRKGEPREVRVA